MAEIANPAWQQFAAQIGNELTLAQVVVRRVGAGFELRHVADEAAAPDALRVVKAADARALAQATAAGAFRPLKSAPNLQSGWRMTVAGESELTEVLNQLYPGAVADWYAAQLLQPPVTDYREFTARQSGMYRITTMLDDAQAARVICACCEAQFCLKRRLWSVAGLAPDAMAGKSLIPCLEPCAIFLEFARKVVRIEQEEKLHLDLAPDEVTTLQAALKMVLAARTDGQREGDVASPANPRRLQLVLKKLESLGLAGKGESD